MSGGSLDYVYMRLNEAAGEIRARSQKRRHLAFADHLDLVAEALHDIEWSFSGDYGPDDDKSAIKAVLRIK